MKNCKMFQWCLSVFDLPHVCSNSLTVLIFITDLIIITYITKLRLRTALIPKDLIVLNLLSIFFIAFNTEDTCFVVVVLVSSIISVLFFSGILKVLVVSGSWHLVLSSKNLRKFFNEYYCYAFVMKVLFAISNHLFRQQDFN